MIAEDNGISAHVRAFSRLLIRLRAVLSNDLDLVLILSVIAERHYARIAQPDQPSGTAINTLSVALYTEIPRETVRRKVAILIDKGWVRSDARGNLSPTEQAARDLAQGTAATMEYLNDVTAHTRSDMNPK